MSDILNFNNSLYEVEQTIELGTAAGKTSWEYEYGNICSEYDIVDEYENLRSVSMIIKMPYKREFYMKLKIIL